LTARTSSGSLVPKTCPKAANLCETGLDQVRQAKADFQLVLLVPG